jgi:hypothetical protein
MAQAKADSWKPTWEDPPDRNSERQLWLTRLNVLVENKGHWALIADYPAKEKSRAHQLRSSLHRRRYAVPHPDHVWEFVTRKGKVYARYVGEADQAED